MYVLGVAFVQSHVFRPRQISDYQVAVLSDLQGNNRDYNLRSILFVRTSFGTRSFGVAVPTIWNSLPPTSRICTRFDRINFVVISKPDISSIHRNHLGTFLLVPHIRLLLTTVPVYKLFINSLT